MIADLVKNGILGLPLADALNRRRHLRRGYDPEKDHPSYPLSVFETHRRAIERLRSIGGNLLEIGPGGNLGVAALFVAGGAAAAVALDPEPWLGTGLDALYRELGVSEMLSRISYERASIEAAPFPDESFDIVISHASFEHFADPLAATWSIARILRPGGVTTHQIDLRDHRDFENPLDFLRFGDRTWHHMTSRRTMHTNRWRASDVRSAFDSAGLDVRAFEPNERCDVTPEMARSFAPRFRTKTLDDLSTLGLFVTAVKPE